MFRFQNLSSLPSPSRILGLTYIYAVILLLSSTEMLGQAGAPAFVPMDNHTYDSINVQQLNVLVHAPIYQKAGAFPLSITFNANSYCTGTTGTWQCGVQSPTVTNFGAITANNFMGGPTNIGWATVYPLVSATAGCPDKTSDTVYSQWVVREANGTLHPLPPTDSIFVGGDSRCPHNSFTDTTIDGSGLTVTVGPGYTAGPVISAGGVIINQGYPSATSITDPNNNEVSVGTSGQYYDTLGMTAATATPNVNAPTSVSWTDVIGNNNDQTLSVTQANVKFQTNFGCTAPNYIADVPAGSSAPQFSGLSYPDGSSLTVTYEATPGKTGYVTGRIASMTLPTGGTITYTYSNICSNGGWTSSIVRTTADGTTTYISGPPFSNANGNWGSQTEVTDQGGNMTLYMFSLPNSVGQSVLVEKQVNLGTSTLQSTTVYCYNNNTTKCNQATVTLPITQMTVQTTVGTQTRQSAYTYDKYGNILSDAEYDFGASSPTTTTTTVYGTWNGSACVAVSSTINNRPCTVNVVNAGNTVAKSQFTYDGYGNLLTKSVWTGKSSGTQWLTSTATYNGNGTAKTSTDPAGNTTSYYYNGTGGCNGVFPTSVVADGMTTHYTWNCTGGVLLTSKDANGNVTTYGYKNRAGTAEPFWRLSSVTDPVGNETWDSYTPNSRNSSLTFNGGNSTVNLTSIVDGYGRLIDKQRLQSPTATQYDTTSTQYSWSTTYPNYRSVTTTLPCSAASAAECSFSSAATTTLLDPLGRTYTVTDGGGGTITKAYSSNDVLSVLGPAPSFDGENTKQVQNEYDGLGRLTKSCHIGNGSHTACGQVTGSSNGVTDAYTYGSGTGYTTVSVQRGGSNGQTRTSYYDGVGRLYQKTTPEGGTWNYYYDSYGSCPTGYTGALGRLTAVKDPNLDLICYAYDSLNRVTGVNANGTTCRHFYYDNSTGYSGSIPTGVTTPTNPYGRMVEAATDACSSGTLITDEWFSYDADGRLTDQWELTPHSTTYYHSTATFFGNGAVNTLKLVGPNYTSTYGVDGEGRWNALSDSSGTTIVNASNTTYGTSTSYNPAGQPTQIALGTGADQDDYTYDNTGRMSGWTFQIGATPKSETAILSWNPIGTLKSLAITDGFNAGGTQTCNFGASGSQGYDDWNRLLYDSCGTGGSIWNQTYSYDQYDNLTKSSSGFVSWNPGYSNSGTGGGTNHYTCTGCTYDSNGNVTNDGTNTYTWNEFSKMHSVNLSGTNCASAGECIVYDALGRAVEVDSGSTYTEIWYTQLGKTAYMNGTTLNYAYYPTPGGATYMKTTGGDTYFHKDWLGNARLISAISNQTVTSDRAFAPYGEIYDVFGSTAQNLAMFTGDTQDVFAGMYDTPNRELQGSQQGRWLSPDPAGAGWNQYAYATNPNSGVDPSGLNVAHGCTGQCDPGGGPGIFSSPNPADMAGDNWNENDYQGYSQQWVENENAPAQVDPTIDAYFDSLDGTQGDVTQERNDAEPNVTLPGWFSALLNPRYVSCSGADIPCYLDRSGPLDLTVGSQFGGYGVHVKHLYTVKDILGNPTQVDSVTEILSVLAASANAPNPTPYTWTGPDDLPLGLFFSDTLELGGPSATDIGFSVVSQKFTASAGGTTYPLINQNTNVLIFGPGGPTGTIGIARSNQGIP
jgi:hypothetical protein